MNELKKENSSLKNQNKELKRLSSQLDSTLIFLSKKEHKMDSILQEKLSKLESLNNQLNRSSSSTSNTYRDDDYNSPSSSGSSSENRCSTCQGSGKCRECSKPQKVHYWKNGWRDDKETRLGKTVCTACKGDGKVKEHISTGKMDSYEKCHVSSCNNGWIKCRKCYGDGECDRCQGKGTRY